MSIYVLPLASRIENTISGQFFDWFCLVKNRMPDYDNDSWYYTYLGKDVVIDQLMRDLWS